MAPAEIIQPRRLIYIPIIHSQEDMGSVSDSVREAYIERKGRQGWEESRLAIRRFWNDIEAKVAALDLDFARVRLFQDGLPVCGFEVRIVRDLATTGIVGANYRILAGLMDRGAALEGTEDVELLLKERRILKSWTADLSGKPMAAIDRERTALAMNKLLEDRDRYIAGRIDEVLRPGEIGILFLGILHKAIEKLPPTILVSSLDEFVSATRHQE